MTATDVSNAGIALQFLNRAIERGQPVRNQVVEIARAEESRHGAEHAPRVIIPTRRHGRF